MIWTKNYNYRKEVTDIIKSMVKISKFNELSGLAPTNV